MDESPMALLPVHVYSPRSDALTSLMFSMVRSGESATDGCRGDLKDTDVSVKTTKRFVAIVTTHAI